MFYKSAPLGKRMKSGRRACSPNDFRSFPRGGQAAKPLCPPHNEERAAFRVWGAESHFFSVAWPAPGSGFSSRLYASA